MIDETKGTELEQVPLKSDTDATVTETTIVVTPVVETTKWKKPWFKFGKKAGAPEQKDEEDGATEAKPKKQCWWTRSCPKGEAEQKADHISIGINLVDRDEKNINNHVQFSFEDIFGEADSQHSWDCVWRFTYKVFTWTRQFAYRLLSLIIALPAAIFFALLFAIVSVINVFACVPLAKLLTVPANWIAKTWSFIVHALIDPLASAIGLVFSSCTIRKYGINSETTEPLV